MSGQVQPIPLFRLKWQAHNGLGPGVLQYPPSLHSHPQPFVPVRIGAEYNFHETSSFQVLWDCSTRRFKSPS